MFHGKAAQLRTALFGISAWATTVVVPAVVMPGHGAAHGEQLLVAGAAPLVLAAGFVPRIGRSSLLPWLWLVLFPTALAATVALLHVSPENPADEGALIVCGALAWLAYGASALSFFAEPRRLRKGEVRPVDVERLPMPERARRMALMGAGALFAFAVTAVVPTWGGVAAYASGWGAAAAEGRIFAVILGAIVGTIALASFFGPMLRAAKVQVTRSAAERRATAFLAAAALSMAALLVYMRAK